MSLQRSRLTPLRLWAILAVLLLFVALVSIWGSMLRPPAVTPHPPLVVLAAGQVYDGPSQAAPRVTEGAGASELEPEDSGE